MSQRLDAREVTRRDIKKWLSIHGFIRYAVDISGAFTQEELLNIIRDAIKEGIENRLAKIDRYGEKAHEDLLN
jgi:hypothetical protein